jgi:hypothetical protein
MDTTMQMQMFDLVSTPTATAAMLADEDLRSAITAMRRCHRSKVTDWPYVEEIDGGLKAWAVDDHGIRFVLVGAMVFDMYDFEILNFRTREAALAVFKRLDAQVAA